MLLNQEVYAFIKYKGVRVIYHKENHKFYAAGFVNGTVLYEADGYSFETVRHKIEKEIDEDRDNE